ncbi:MAG: hypothetical protein IKX88_03620, partial [Thermoguttaceae bacterium]|nr:hypothetical protein [Thermoguttaceae bacterium]
DPRNGSWQTIGEFANEGKKTFTPPTMGEDLDMILVIDDASKNYPAPGVVENKGAEKGALGTRTLPNGAKLK